MFEIPIAKLKPCPFCGGDAIIIYDEDEITVRIGCKDESCYAFVEPSNPIAYITADLGVTAWNRRVRRSTAAFPPERSGGGNAMLICRGTGGKEKQ